MKSTKINLVPDITNPTPDYYCTWQTQLYATNDGKPDAQRAIICEKGLFDNNKPYGWAYFYEKARKDLFLVMDDSWDVPICNDGSYYGSLVLNSEKFPSFAKNNIANVEALKSLVDKVKSLGWKGLGGWVCAQESEALFSGENIKDYWKERFIEAHKAGFSYWKVDWGKRAGCFEFRKILSELGKKYAPDLIVENSMIKDVIPYSDTFRTYDVPAIMSIPMTIEKICEFSNMPVANKGRLGLINCEDEAYMAAAGGFAMGIMRHPFSGDFMNGKADMSFPSVHRNLKTKIYEVVRAARWHRIAPAFSTNANTFSVSDLKLTDNWKFENISDEIEEWWFKYPMISDCVKNGVFSKSAVSSIARNAELARVEEDCNGYIPFTITSKNPNGAFSVATLGRTNGRNYFIPKCNISVNSGDSQIIGVFGEYESLTLNTKFRKIIQILMQDLADDNSYDITNAVSIIGSSIKIPGDLISKIGTICQPDNDTSEPGVVIKIVV